MVLSDTFFKVTGLVSARLVFTEVWYFAVVFRLVAHLSYALGPRTLVPQVHAFVLLDTQAMSRTRGAPLPGAWPVPLGSMLRLG